MEGLIDSLDTAKWKEVSMADKTDDYGDYSISRTHKQIDDTTFSYAMDSIDGQSEGQKVVTIEHCKKDPLKNINTCEFRIGEGNKVTGLDLNCDIVVLQ
jgi:hypothetical protein